MARSDIFSFVGDLITCGTNTVTELVAQPGQNAIQIKIADAGSGTLSIGGATGTIQPWSGVGMTFGLGYLVSPNEICVSNMMGPVYLWVSGGTMQIAVLGGRTPGDY